MDKITEKCLELLETLRIEEMVFVPFEIIGAFKECCRDLHILIHASNIDRDGQYFYI